MHDPPVIRGYDTDKMLEYYASLIAPLTGRSIVLLEIGVRTGGSLLLWRDLFPQSTIVGIDRELPDALRNEERIVMFQGDQADTRFLSDVAAKVAPDGFDMIIDDASHVGAITKISFWHLFDRHLKSGGLYVIEDWGTGYWDDWPDGRAFGSTLAARWPAVATLLEGRRRAWKTHSHGMVGFIKELVDEQGIADLLRARSSGTASRESKFAQMTIFPSIVAVTKASGGANLEHERTGRGTCGAVKAADTA